MAEARAVYSGVLSRDSHDDRFHVQSFTQRKLEKLLTDSAWGVSPGNFNGTDIIFGRERYIICVLLISVYSP